MSSYKFQTSKIEGRSRVLDEEPSTLLVPDRGPHTYQAVMPYAASDFTACTPDTTSVATPTYSTASYMDQMTYQDLQDHNTYPDQAGPYLNVVPEVTSFDPPRGGAGTRFCVHVTALYELMTTDAPIFFITFGRLKCQAGVSRTGQQGGVCQYEISVVVPRFGMTAWSATTVPIVLYLESCDGDILSRLDVGDFTYLDAGVTNHQTQRKRKLSDGSCDIARSPAKRVSHQQYRARPDMSTYDYPSTASFPPYMVASTAHPTTQHYPQSDIRPYHPVSRVDAFNFHASIPVSPNMHRTILPQATNWNTSNVRMPESHMNNPGFTSGTRRLSSTAMDSPQLIRTSTIAQETSNGFLSQHGNDKTRGLYPMTAKLEIKGDLETMTQNWTDDEWQTRRRIVRFWRSQAGNVISAEFDAVAPADRPNHSICVSCIYWEEREAWYITSVDTIYLCEQLVAQQYSIPEKNRVRRNLEDLRPLTISKSRTDTEQFFKLIMGLPNPKPRNIEKDVKVFKWKDLASALKKIMSKYVSALQHLAPKHANNIAVSTCATTSSRSDAKQRDRVCS